MSRNSASPSNRQLFFSSTRVASSREGTTSVAHVDCGFIGFAPQWALLHADGSRSPLPAWLSLLPIDGAPKPSSKGLVSGEFAALARNAQSPTCVPLPPYVQVTLVPEADDRSLQQDVSGRREER